VADFGKNCDCGTAVAEQHFLKSCGITIAEVLPSSCGIAIADSKKVARAHLWQMVLQSIKHLTNGATNLHYQLIK
jgi:hypothetical protein